MPKDPKPATAYKGGPGLTKPLTPSHELATITGLNLMPRAEVVAKV